MTFLVTPTPAPIVAVPGAGTDAEAGTKRKRTRSRKQADGDGTGQAAEDGAAPPAPAVVKRARKRRRTKKGGGAGSGGGSGSGGEYEGQPPVDAPSAGPIPEEDERLDEGARNALSYARTFLLSRPSWKFHKARQNWILRHCLALPPPTDTTEEPIPSATDQGEGEGQGAPAATNQHIPDDYLRLVGWYLRDIQGGAKTRLVETLRSTIAPHSDAVQTAAGATPAPPPPVGLGLGDFALSHDATAGDEVAAVSPSLSASDLEWRSQRAKRLLWCMGEVAVS